MTGSPPFPRWLLASALAFTLLFMAWPQLDLIANGVFYRTETGFLFAGMLSSTRCINTWAC